MERPQTSRTALNRAVTIAGVALVVCVAVWCLYNVWRNNRLMLAHVPLGLVTLVKSTTFQPLNDAARRGEAVTPKMARSAFREAISLIETFKIPEGAPEEYKAGFRDYLGSCKALLAYLEGHSSDQAVGNSSTKILDLIDPDKPLPQDTPAPVRERVQAMWNAEGRLHALAQRDGIEPRKAD